ncbi:hypothetical protein G3A56_14160 [Rhizobium oryzihabitans]|uniref:Stage II sporulation protein M n=1 Tax=Rhizobium oryzihabitans TaxID=2267833 RepID=A0A7L5BJF2_9HYPH|nr:stage II sporulation protein M [Rhizobium oryzihabitans]QIB39001.1 hypothetical protein G3A56_14160 [Rhizobium oryzihabitans]
MEPPMDVLHGPFAVIRKHRKAFLTLNVAFYGLFAVSMAITMLLPEIQAYLKTGIDEAYLRPGVLKTVADAYGSQNLPKAMGMTFIINLLVAFVMTTLPSLIIPFIGILATLHRGILWGIMFAPLGAHKAMLIPHSITLLIEGQAYVLAAFGAYVHGRTFLRISEYRVSTRWEAWKAGLVPLANIYCLVIFALAVAAIYEVLEAIYIIPRII